VFLGDTAPAKFPHTLAWVDKISARPAVKVALAKVDAVQAATTAFDKAKAENLDRMFGRGSFAAT
jgi:hypothetical protein